MILVLDFLSPGGETSMQAQEIVWEVGQVHIHVLKKLENRINNKIFGHLWRERVLFPFVDSSGVGQREGV